MTNASPSTHAIVSIENASCLATEPSKPTYIRTETRSTRAAAIVANAHAVPAAASQFKLKNAVYGAGTATTGGRRWISVCEPGHSIGTLTVIKTLADRG